MIHSFEQIFCKRFAARSNAEAFTAPRKSYLMTKNTQNNLNILITVFIYRPGYDALILVRL